MLTDPRVSACVVLYHSGAKALDTIRCIQHATLPVDLFVVDNSPSDPTGRVIEQMVPRATYLPQQKNLGYGAANNLVIPMLRSTYHLILNPDVTFEPDLLARMVDFMDRHKDIVILTPRVFNPDGSEQFLPKRRPSVRYLLSGRLAYSSRYFRRLRDAYTMADHPAEQPMTVDFATGCFMLIRTHYFYQLKGFDQRFFLYHEDSDLTLRAKKLGEVVYHPDMHVTHSWQRQSSRSFKALMAHVSASCKFFTKWGWKW